MTGTTKTVFTDEEHIARAMLLGMSYHSGNGLDPFYYKEEHGVPDPNSFIDANTLEPFMDSEYGPGIHWAGLNKRSKARRALVERWME